MEANHCWSPSHGWCPSEKRLEGISAEEPSKDNIVLTSAYCVTVGPEKPRVQIGKLSRIGADDGSDYEELYTGKTVIHEDYGKDAQFDNDVALLLLVGRSRKEVIPLASSKSCFKDGGDCGLRILGWGDPGRVGGAAAVLQQEYPTISSKADCGTAHGPESISASMICADGGKAGGVDSCAGDSGGPMLHHGEQVGIISWGVGCGDPIRPGVYTSIPKLLPWIQSKLASLDYGIIAQPLPLPAPSPIPETVAYPMPEPSLPKPEAVDP